MKRIFKIACFILCLATQASAQDFSMREETKGLKVKISDDTDFSIRLRMQPRFDMGDLIASKDGKSYTSETDMYLRRLRLEMNGKLTQDLKFDLTFEADKNGIRGKDNAAKSNEVKIQYAYLDYKFDDAANIRFGKAKLPYSRVSLTSSSKQLLIERPVSTEAAKKLFDDYYQTNAMLHGSFADGLISYNLATADGWESKNTIATGTTVLKSGPLYVARVEVSPPGFTEKGKSDAWIGQGQHVTLGFSTASQNSIEYKETNYSEDRTLMGADISAHFGGLTLQGEYIEWKIDTSNGTTGDQAPKGFYAQAGYFIPGINIEPVARYENFDQNSLNSNMKETDTTIGVNWYGKGHSFKIGANWIHSDYGDDAKSDVSVKGSDDSSRDVYQIQAQMYF